MKGRTTARQYRKWLTDHCAQYFKVKGGIDVPDEISVEFKLTFSDWILPSDLPN